MLVASVIALCINAAVAIVIVLIGNYSQTEWRILGTSIALFAYCIALLSCVNYYNENRGPKTLIHTVGSAAFCSLMAFVIVLAIWNIATITFESLSLSAVLFLLVTVHAAFVLPLRNADRRITMVKTATLTLSAIASLLFLALIWFGYYGDFILRLHLVILILLVLGTILIPILGHIFKLQPEPDSHRDDLASPGGIEPPTIP